MSAATAPGLAALMAWELDGDPTQADAIHLRVLLHPRGGLPVVPIVIGAYGGRPTRGTDATTRWLQQGRRSGPGASVSADAPLEIWLLDDGRGVPLWVDVEGEGELRVAAVSPQPAPDGTLVELAARSQPPWTLAVPGLRRVVVSGDGRVDAIQRCGDDFDPGRAGLVLGLPLPSSAWYLAAGSIDPDERVREGVRPDHALWPADDPTGTQQATQDDELARVRALAADPMDALRDALQDPDVPPAEATTTHEDDDQGWSATISAATGLWAGALDPGFARYVGLMGVSARPEIDGGAVAIFGAATITAIAADVGAPYATDTDDAGLVHAWIDAATGGGLDDFLQDLRARGMRPVQRLAIGACALGAPPDPPAAPRVTLAAAHWHPYPARSYTRLLTCERAGVGPLAVARLDADGGAQPLGDPYDVPDAPTWTVRRRLLVPGRPPADAGLPDRSRAAIDDDDADESTSGWRVHAADLVGRWSDPADVDARPPPPPALPAPHVEAHLLPADGADAATIEARVVHPDSYPAGTVESPWLIVDEHGYEQPAPAGTGALLRFPAPVAAAGETLTVALHCRYADATRDQTGPQTVASVHVVGPAPPPPPPIRHALQFASAAAPTGSAYLELDVPTGALVRDYRLTRYEEAELRDLLPAALHDASRALRADWLVRNAAQLRGSGTLVRTRCAPGSVVTVELSGSLQSLVLLRLIPTSVTGHTLPAAQCPILACAVPDGVGPPAPALRSGPAGELSISCPDPGGRIDLVRVRHAPAGTARGPQMTALAAVGLGPPDADGMRHASLAPPPARPYARIAYTVEASAPPEPALAPGSTPAAGEVPRDAPRIWGAAGPPLTVRRRPDGPPPAPSAVTAAVTAGQTQLAVAVAPQIVATDEPHRLEGFLLDAAGDQVASAAADVDDAAMTLTLAAAGPGTARVRVVDPDGRASATTDAPLA